MRIPRYLKCVPWVATGWALQASEDNILVGDPA